MVYYSDKRCKAYSSLDQTSHDNGNQPKVAWTYQTGYKSNFNCFEYSTKVNNILFDTESSIGIPYIC